MPRTDDRNQLLRNLPAVDAVLAAPEVQALMAERPRELVAEGVRRAIAERRAALLAGLTEETGVGADDVLRAIEAWLRPVLRRVINATGVILHTNLGRAPLPPAALARVSAIAGGYSNLEMDLERGKRGSRMDLIRAILRERTGGEDVLVVNNNAAAVYLALRTLAAGREAIVSRGELVEIGGSFRVPDVMAASGAVLCEVGTTNRTRLADYARAIGPDTGLVMKVHRSNFQVVGFTEEAPLAELAGLCRERGLPLLMDMGAGILLDDLPACLLESSVARVLAQGPDLLCFSGDKLLGGPQAGILVGRAELIGRLAKDPMARALRVDKMTLAALEAVLSLYRGGREGARAIPVVEMLLARPEALRERAERLLGALQGSVPQLDAEVVQCASQVGGGSLPMEDFPSWAVVVRPAGGRVERLAEILRTDDPAVLVRRQQDSLWLDVRTVLDEAQLEALAQAVARALARVTGEAAR